METEAMMLGKMAEKEMDRRDPKTIWRARLEFQVACAVTQLVGLVQRDGLCGPDDLK